MSIGSCANSLFPTIIYVQVRERNVEKRTIEIKLEKETERKVFVPNYSLTLMTIQNLFGIENEQLILEHAGQKLLR